MWITSGLCRYGATNRAFGLPKILYCDNGSEYLFADYLDDALKLNIHVRR